MLNMTLDKIEIDALQPQLEDYCEKLNASALREANQAKLQSSFTVPKNASKYATTNFGQQRNQKSPVNLSTSTKTPISSLKLSKTQKKKGPPAIIEMWKGPNVKKFAIDHCGMTEEQLTQFQSKFTVPFIYQTLESGKACFVCKYEFPFGAPLSDGQKVAHVNCDQHKDKIKVWTQKIDSLLGFNVPFQMKALLFMYDPIMDCHLGNWNHVVSHLETHHS